MRKLALSLMLLCSTTFAVVVPEDPIAPGHYKVVWRMDRPVQINAAVFDKLMLEGNVTDADTMLFSGMFIVSSNLGAHGVQASCFKNSIGGVFCTLFCPDKNRFLSVAHDGSATMSDIDFSDERVLTRAL